jgi:hypothetical protein
MIKKHMHKCFEQLPKSYRRAEPEKRALVAATLRSPLEDFRAYWRTRSIGERLARVERMRRLKYGIKATTAPMEKVIEVLELRSSPKQGDRK